VALVIVWPQAMGVARLFCGINSSPRTTVSGKSEANLVMILDFILFGVF
jgi:hypothetical protein